MINTLEQLKKKVTTLLTRRNVEPNCVSLCRLILERNGIILSVKLLIWFRSS